MEHPPNPQSGERWQDRADRLARQAVAAGDPTGWFDRLYGAAAAGEIDLPWRRSEPHPLLAQWADRRAVTGTGRTALVVGSGLGADAEFLAALGFRTTGVDISAAALALTRQRYPDSAVTYRVADLLAPPADLRPGFDLVVDVFTVQALPDPPRRQAIVNVGRLVGPGGTLVAVAITDEVVVESSPPWPLPRADIEAYATDGLTAVSIERVPDPRTGDPRWLAEFTRPESVAVAP